MLSYFTAQLLQRVATIAGLLGLLAASVPVAQSTTFTLASSGCSQKHCTQAEDGKIGFSTPAPSTTGGSLALYTPNSGGNPAGAGDGTADGCSSNGPLWRARWRTRTVPRSLWCLGVTET